jgi:transposase-like protein
MLMDETQRSEFSISELAREFDITPRAIRFYEDPGLLAPRREGQQARADEAPVQVYADSRYGGIER